MRWRTLVVPLGLALALGLGSACSTPAAKIKGKDVIETIQETTVGDLDGVRCPMANMGEDTYVLPDGTTKTGMTATLYPGEEGLYRVGVGSVVEIEGTRWEVINVSKPPGEPLGSVTLRKEGTGGEATLDFKYHRECTNCGELSGWTGKVEAVLGRDGLLMRCTHCRNEFVVSGGAYIEVLKDGAPPYMPGRGTG